jgi:hypothetical protein
VRTDVRALASGWGGGFALRADGSLAGAPLAVVDLDGAEALSDAELAAAARAARSALTLVVGTGSGPLPDRLRGLVDALTLTVSPVASDRAVVPVADPAAELERLVTVAAASPRAAVVLGQVLRQTEQLDVRSGLAAEAAAYSMLLAGPEMGAWLSDRGGPRPARGPGERVAVSRHGDVLRVEMDRPDRRNAFDAGMRDALVDALLVALADPQVTLELSGRGSCFSSGGDLDEFGSTADVGLAYVLRLERHPGWLLHQLGPRATVRLHGACIGAGVEMPALAARVVAARDTWFGLPEVAMGVIPGAGGTVGIPRRIGRWRTAWLALSGRRLDAATALEWGLVDELVG